VIILGHLGLLGPWANKITTKTIGFETQLMIYEDGSKSVHAKMHLLGDGKIAKNL
jgi:hypothetical protein